MHTPTTPGPSDEPSTPAPPSTTTPEGVPAPRLPLTLAVALLQGIALWLLWRSVRADQWPATSPAWFTPLVALAMLVPPAFHLLGARAATRRGALALGALATLLAAVGAHHGAFVASPDVHPGDGAETFAFAVALGVLWFHLLPFAQAWLATGRRTPDYRDLFRNAWHDALLLALAGLFTGLLWLLLWLWAELFELLGIDLFARLFRDSVFAIPTTAVTVGLAIHLAGSVESLLDALRRQVLALLKWLLVVAALILVLFTVALLARSPTLFVEQRRVIGAAWLLWLVAWNVFFLNAAYQDGRAGLPYPCRLATLLRCAMLALPVVAVLALYAVAVRVQRYGLTTERAWAALVATLAVCYGLGYAWAALRRGEWMAGMGRVNVAVAGLLIVAVTSMLLPPLSPWRLAAASQTARALDVPARSEADAAGPASREDALWVLRFDAGEYGRRRLAALATDASLPEDLRAAAKRMHERGDRWAPPGQGRIPPEELALQPYPAGSSVPPALRAAIGADLGTANACRRPTRPCPALALDLDRDGRVEVTVLPPFGAVVYGERDGEWRVVARGHPVPGVAVPGGHDPAEERRDALARGDVGVLAPAWPDLQVGAERIRLDPAER